MSDSKKKPEQAQPAQPLDLRELLPDAAAVFEKSPPSLVEVYPEADVVLDANVLLLPYTTGRDSVQATAKLFGQLAQEKRLFLPAQAAREYARNRPSKIAQVVQHISNTLSKASPATAPRLPMLEGVEEYESLQKVEAELRERTESYQDELRRLLGKAKSWGRADPVSVHYAGIFTKDNVVELATPFADLVKEGERRYTAKRPPGYKDASKEEGGLGDLIIWKTILEIAEKRKRHLIFVSGDEKADWVHRANNEALMPRIELLDEFRRTSGGSSFYLARLSRLLELGGATEEAVDGFRREEAKVRERRTESLQCPNCMSPVSWLVGGAVGSSAFPLCKNCDHRFHAHRTGTGVIVRARHSRSDKVAEMRNWFFQNYMDPANGVPYNGKEGGYLYINGGPFDAHDELFNQFGDEAPEDLIESVVAEVETEGTEWVKIGDY